MILRRARAPARFEADLLALLGAGGVLALLELVRVLGWGRCALPELRRARQLRAGGLDRLPVLGGLARACRCG